MKILLMNKYHYRKGGAERAYFDMADILQRSGHEVAFFAMEHAQNESTPWSKYFVSEVDYRNKQYTVSQKIKTALALIWNHEANTKLQALIDDFQPDVAHAHNIYHQLSPSIFHVLKRNKIPSVLTLHDYKLVSPNYNLYSNGAIWDHSSGLLCIWDRCIQESRAKSVVCALEKWLHQLFGSYHLADVLISPSRFLAEKAKALGWTGREIQVLPNPLRKEELLDIPYEQVPVSNRLVFFGRLSPEKGVEQILEALVFTPQKQLFLIGEGPQREELEKLTQNLGLEDRVTFLGARYGADLRKELLQAEAVVIPSVWYENLPYVITESLALGLVVVATESGGITERITHRENGFLYPRQNIQALATLLNALEKEDLGMIRKNARESVSDLDPDFFAKKLEKIYQSII